MVTRSSSQACCYAISIRHSSNPSQKLSHACPGQVPWHFTDPPHCEKNPVLCQDGNNSTSATPNLTSHAHDKVGHTASSQPIVMSNHGRVASQVASSTSTASAGYRGNGRLAPVLLLGAAWASSALVSSWYWRVTASCTEFAM